MKAGGRLGLVLESNLPEEAPEAKCHSGAGPKARAAAPAAATIASKASASGLPRGSIAPKVGSRK
jgi:hypothetical protein